MTTGANDPKSAALAAYWRFFEGGNSRAAARWSDGLNFPHVRLSPRAPVRIVPDRATHAAAVSWESVRASGAPRKPDPRR